MKFWEYSHRHGKELLSLAHPKEHDEICGALHTLPAFPHGVEKKGTPKEYIAGKAFERLDLEKETEIPLGTGKNRLL